MKQIWNRIRSINSAWSQTFGLWIIKWRWAVLAASIVIAIVAASGGRFLQFNNDYHVFFSKANPQLQAYDALQNKYTKDDNVFIVVQPSDEGVFEKETLEAIEELTALAWKTPHSTRVDAITNFQYTRSVEDDLYVDDLIYQVTGKNAKEIDQIRKIAIQEPLLRNRLVDSDATLTGVNITVRLPGKTMGEEKVVIAYVRDILEDFETKYPDLKTYTTGMIMLSGAFGEAAESDMSFLVPLMFLGIIMVILIFTRSFSSTFASLLILIFSIMTAMGLAGWLGIQLTPVSASAPTMIMTLAIADSIHILITMLQSMRRGQSKRAAIVESLRINFMPVLITSLTTVIGFLTMNFSDSPLFHDLGNVTAIGISAAFLYSIVTLPALLAILPVKVKVTSNSDKLAFMERFAEWIIPHNKKLLWASSLAVVVISVFTLKNELNDDFINYFDQSIQFRQDTDYISENLTGIYTIEYSLGAGESGGISNPEYLQHLQRFERWFEEQADVVHVNSFTEVARRVNKSMHGDDPAYYRLPQSREEAAQYLLLYEMSLPFGLDLNDQINVDKSETRFIVTVENITSNQLIALSTKAENWLRENTPEYMHATGISTGIMFSHLTQRQIQSMIGGGITALILISAVLMLALKSFRHGLISLIPNITPIAAGFGIWGLTTGQINAGIAVVFGMTLGIIVDDTVHFLSKYLRARREQNKSSEDAIRYAFSTVGTALVVTTIVLVFGFIILAQSGFGMNSGMAKITALTITLALIIDFIMLPSLLIATSREKIAKWPSSMIPQQS